MAREIGFRPQDVDTIRPCERIHTIALGVEDEEEERVIRPRFNGGVSSSDSVLRTDMSTGNEKGGWLVVGGGWWSMLQCRTYMGRFVLTCFSSVLFFRLLSSSFLCFPFMSFFGHLVSHVFSPPFTSFHFLSPPFTSFHLLSPPFTSFHLLSPPFIVRSSFCLPLLLPSGLCGPSFPRTIAIDVVWPSHGGVVALQSILGGATKIHLAIDTQRPALLVQPLQSLEPRRVSMPSVWVPSSVAGRPPTDQSTDQSTDQCGSQTIPERGEERGEGRGGGRGKKGNGKGKGTTTSTTNTAQHAQQPTHYDRYHRYHRYHR